MWVVSIGRARCSRRDNLHPWSSGSSAFFSRNTQQKTLRDAHGALWPHLSIYVSAPWQHLLHRASFDLQDALHGDRGAAPSPYIRGSVGVRDRCRRVRCQAGFQRKRRVISVGQNYRSKRLGVLFLPETASTSS